MCVYWFKYFVFEVKDYLVKGEVKVEVFYFFIGGVVVDFGEMEFDYFFNINMFEDVVEVE